MYSIPTIIAVATPPGPQLDVLMLLGFLCALATIVCYLQQSRSRSFILAFAVSSILLATFAFLKDVWPVGIVELVWAGAALRRWWSVSARQEGKQALGHPTTSWQPESRISRLFGHEIRSN